jgi:hypothetical protein
VNQEIQSAGQAPKRCGVRKLAVCFVALVMNTLPGFNSGSYAQTAPVLDFVKCVREVITLQDFAARRADARAAELQQALQRCNENLSNVPAEQMAQPALAESLVLFLLSGGSVPDYIVSKAAVAADPGSLLSERLRVASLYAAGRLTADDPQIKLGADDNLGPVTAARWHLARGAVLARARDPAALSAFKEAAMLAPGSFSDLAASRAIVLASLPQEVGQAAAEFTRILRRFPQANGQARFVDQVSASIARLAGPEGVTFLDAVAKTEGVSHNFLQAFFVATAERAITAGNAQTGRAAAKHAIALSDGDALTSRRARLYEAVSAVVLGDVENAQQTLRAFNTEGLAPSDRALRWATLSIAESITVSPSDGAGSSLDTHREFPSGEAHKKAQAAMSDVASTLASIR